MNLANETVVKVQLQKAHSRHLENNNNGMKKNVILQHIKTHVNFDCTNLYDFFIFKKPFNTDVKCTKMHSIKNLRLIKN